MDVSWMERDLEKHLKALGMFFPKMKRMSRAGLFPSNIWRADTEGKRSKTLLCGFKGQCVADAEGIQLSITKNSVNMRVV